MIGYGELRPYGSPETNTLASFAQMNIFFHLFVGLLLKVRIDSAVEDDGAMFGRVVTLLSVATPLAPVGIKIAAKLMEMDPDNIPGFDDDDDD